MYESPLVNGVLSLLLCTALVGLASGCASEGRAVRRVHPRVLSAATPIPGADSYYDRIWVLQHLDRWKIEGVRQCLEQHGRKDLWPRAEEPIRARAMHADQRVPSRKMLESIGFDWRRAPDANATVDDKDLVLWDCDGSENDNVPGNDEAESKRFDDLESAWSDELDKVLDDPKYAARKQEVNACLTAGGAQLNSHDDGSTSKGWEGEFVLGAATEDAMSDEQAKAAGKLMVKCTQPLWDEWEKVLTPQRADFAEKHAKDLAEISAAIDHAG